MVKSKRVSLAHAAEMKTAYQIGGVRGRALCDMFPQYSRSTVYHYATKNFSVPDEEDKRKHNPGRPKKLSAQDGRRIIRTLKSLRKNEGSFTSRRIQEEAGLSHAVSNRTVRRHLTSNGFRYLRSRKKGLLNWSDLQKRLHFCKKIERRNLGSEFWRTEVSIYLDGKGFQYKSNPNGQARAPKSREWRMPSEGLDYGCVAKGQKEGATNANFMVAISYDKGVVLAKQYFGSITGEKFTRILNSADFEDALENSGNPQLRRMLMDGCPRQNAGCALQAMEDLGVLLMKIPARSPDLNPIENVFHLVGRKLQQDAISQNITRETFEQFSARVKNTLESFPIETINRTIDSMPRRIKMVIERKGQRIRY